MDGERHSSSRRKSKRSRSDAAPNGRKQDQSRPEPILIAARRPNAPFVAPKRRFIAASAAPRNGGRSQPDPSEPKQRENLAGKRVGEPSTGGCSHSARAADGSNQDRAGIGPLDDVQTHQAGGSQPAEGRERLSPESGAPMVSDDSLPRRTARIVQVRSDGPDDREKQRLKLIERLLRSEGRVAITRAACELEAAGFEFPVVQDVQLQLLEHVDESRAHQALCQLTKLLTEEAPIKRPLFEQRLRRLEEFADDAETREAAADLRRTVRA
jgi:hypothetical protein